LYLWGWFQDVSTSITRVRDGAPQRIPPSEFLAWAMMTGRLVEPAEYAILREMDMAFCAALSVEIAEANARRRAAQEQKAGAGKRKRR
jgi:hypothetical protein